MSYIKFEILKFFGRNLAKFIAPASSILAKIKIWSYDQKKNPKKPHKTVIKIFIWDKKILAIFLTRSSTPSKVVNLTIFVFWCDSMNQNIYKTFMMFFSVFRLNIMSNLNFGQNQRSWSYKFGQILAEKFQNFKFDKTHENYWYDAKKIIVLHKSLKPGQILA